MRGRQKSILFATLVALLAALDVLVAIAGANVTAGRVSVVKALMALSLQVASIALLAFFIPRPSASSQSAGPFEQFRTWATPYFLFVLAVAFTLTLLYNAVACGDQSFVHGRKGEPICKS